jgi:NUMOD3 motif
MNYFLLYQRLIANAKARVCPHGYVERHHVLPKALGGSDDSSNLVALTAKEHFLAHVLLAKIHGGDMWLPVIRMKTFKDGTKANSRLYEMARVANALEVGKRLKGSKLSDEHKKKIAKSGTGLKRSEETKRKISEALKNKPKSSQHRKSLSEAIMGSKRFAPSPLAGRKQSPEHIAKRVEAILAKSRG